VIAPQRARAVAMLSGGLDSTLALRLVVDQGIEVIAINFSTGFCHTDHARQVQRKGQDPARLRNQALHVAAQLAVPVEIIDIADEYLPVLKYPRYGYGQNANPCIDCRILMMTRAREFMARCGAAFVFTGEVLGQRPKSQHRHALALIAQESGLRDRLVRPLCARLLAPTRPEREGILDRTRLLDFHGRDRKPQMDLARRLGIADWPQPAGGCCTLTDPSYARRLFDLFEHGRRDDLGREDALLCKVGRHFRIDPARKVIVGRFEEENAFLRRFAGVRPVLEALEVNGPSALLDGPPTEEALALAAAITARYGDGKRHPMVRVRCQHLGQERILEVEPLPPERCESWLVR
jgi:tRNA-specific 2-thiouridylase